MLKLDVTQENQKRNCGRLLQLQSQQQNLVGQLSSSLMRWMPSALGATQNISMRPELLHSYSLSWMGQLHRKVFASHPVSVYTAQLTSLHSLVAIFHECTSRHPVRRVLCCTPILPNKTNLAWNIYYHHAITYYTNLS